MIDTKDFLKKAPEFRPAFNVGGLLDIPTGSYHRGVNGESILCGGLYHITGVTARGNCFKSTLMHFMMLSALNRYTQAYGTAYDTENSLTLNRMIDLSSRMENLTYDELDERLTITDTGMYGNEYFEGLKKYGQHKVGKNGVKEITTEFVNRQGELIKMLPPTFAEIDSLSQMPIQEVTEKIHDKNQIGVGAMNPEALRSAAAKNQMVIQLPAFTTRYGMYMLISAHLGEEFKIDGPYAPDTKKLAFLKQNVKLKNVPEKFTFLTNNLWWCFKSVVLSNDADKTVKYPKHSKDKVPEDKDLNLLTVINLRGKHGPTGVTIRVIVSQSEGILPELSEYHFLKEECKGEGIFEGNNLNFSLALLPDLKLQRTTIRGLINERPDLCRALNICAEMMQMQKYWRTLDKKYICTPKELYEDIIALGYDWNVLLKTRGYWVFKEAKHPLPFLSTMDLLKMRTKEYTPKWYKKAK